MSAFDQYLSLIQGMNDKGYSQLRRDNVYALYNKETGAFEIGQRIVTRPALDNWDRKIDLQNQIDDLSLQSANLNNKLLSITKETEIAKTQVAQSTTQEHKAQWLYKLQAIRKRHIELIDELQRVQREKNKLQIEINEEPQDVIEDNTFFSGKYLFGHFFFKDIPNFLLLQLPISNKLSKLSIYQLIANTAINVNILLALMKSNKYDVNDGTPLPRNLPISSYKRLFDYGYYPSREFVAKKWINENISQREMQFLNLYRRYVDLPYTDNNTSDLLRLKGIFISSAKNSSLHAVINDIVTRVDKKGDLSIQPDSFGLIAGLSEQHSINELKVRDGIISFVRFSLPNKEEMRIAFRYKRMVNRVARIFLLHFTDCLKYLEEIREFLHPQQYHNYVFARAIDGDFTADLAQLKDYNINGIIQYASYSGSPVVCSAYAGNEVVLKRLISSGASLSSLKDGSFAKAIANGIGANKLGNNFDFLSKYGGIYVLPEDDYRLPRTANYPRLN